ncbi:hypothetical protein [Salinarimonas soli]|uniref:Uncharacterized protein n=1 Tax=Salinarimonas soli TaxID=1638099 RepID=A0A5B2VAS5_9HYPH|nr:hypothetical protein [Salinarimonas soli]KAA2235550.1 hypothetical protein F0L46_18780 [Salinarimonas soli]
MPHRTLALLILLAVPQPTDAACRALRAESDVTGIRLADEESTARVLGPPSELRSEQPVDGDGRDSGFPFVRIRSRDGTHEAKLFTHHGGTLGAYSEIEVGPADPDATAVPTMPGVALATERGVRLGMRRADVVRLLGPCFRREQGSHGEAVIAYAITDPGHPLLKRSGSPSYFARYAFKAGRLVRFRFGFEPV